MSAPRGNGLATILLIWYNPMGVVPEVRKPKTVSRLAYRGTFDPRKAQITPSQPADQLHIGQRLSPRLAALFAFALDEMN